MEQEQEVVSCLQLCCLDDRCLCFQLGLTIFNRAAACFSVLGDLDNLLQCCFFFCLTWEGEAGGFWSKPVRELFFLGMFRLSQHYLVSICLLLFLCVALRTRQSLVPHWGRLNTTLAHAKCLLGQKQHFDSVTAESLQRLCFTLAGLLNILNSEYSCCRGTVSLHAKIWRKQNDPHFISSPLVLLI